MPGEFDYIAWLRARTPAAPGVLVGPGDDCAVLVPPARPLLVTTDMLMDGTDFVLSACGARAAGRKAMAANLSDLAAMAGTPRFAVVSVALPREPKQPTPPAPLPEGRAESRLAALDEPAPSSDAERSETSSSCPPLPAGRGARGVGRTTHAEHTSLPHSLYLGLRECADTFGVAIVGGDTNSWNGPLVISVTAFGEAHARGAVLRSGARPGDWLFVTGQLGGSIRGRHLTFTPRVREALALADAVQLRAMCDISDGLAADLNHILEESHCGAVLNASAIPVHADAHELAHTSGKPALKHALSDGEDFELVFAVSPEDGAKLLRETPVPVFRVGECVERGLWLEANGTRAPLAPEGWVHPM
jgi:thiamine-monophosphate kinase